VSSSALGAVARSRTGLAANGALASDRINALSAMPVRTTRLSLAFAVHPRAEPRYFV